MRSFFTPKTKTVSITVVSIVIYSQYEKSLNDALIKSSILENFLTFHGVILINIVAITVVTERSEIIF